MLRTVTYVCILIYGVYTIYILFILMQYIFSLIRHMFIFLHFSHNLYVYKHTMYQYVLASCPPGVEMQRPAMVSFGLSRWCVRCGGLCIPWNNHNLCWWQPEIPRPTTWDVQNPVNNGINYYPQLVSLPDFFNQQYDCFLLGWPIFNKNVSLQGCIFL